jgi:SNF2 family DNA or RNA helicase
MSETTNASTLRTKSRASKKSSAKPEITGSYAGMFGSTKERAAPSHTVPPLFEHQRKTVEMYKTTPLVYDTSSPGTGKTRSHLEAWHQRRKAGGGKLLVLAPKSLVEAAWGHDIKKFLPDVPYSVALAPDREKGFSHEAEIYITNHETIKWLDKNRTMLPKGLDSLVVDEITAFKHRTSQRSKALKALCKSFKYRAGLTGTPNANSVTELWHQIFVLDDGRRLGPSFFAFRNAVQTPVNMGIFTEWNDKPGSIEAVSGLISDISVRHKLEDCIEIPPNHVYSVPYTMPKRLRAMYDTLRAQSALALLQRKVTAVHAASLATKLLQVASGAVYDDAGYSLLDPARYELVADLVEERKHSLVFFVWRHQKEQLKKELVTRGISHAIIDGETPQSERAKIVDTYQAGRLRTLLLHPRTGAHGLTLTRGTTTIFASPIYEADLLEQAKHRIYRAGQTQRTETILVEALGTIEAKVYARLKEKHTRMFDLLKILEGV